MTPPPAEYSVNVGQKYELALKVAQLEIVTAKRHDSLTTGPVLKMGENRKSIRLEVVKSRADKIRTCDLLVPNLLRRCEKSQHFPCTKGILVYKRQHCNYSAGLQW